MAKEGNYIEPKMRPNGLGMIRAYGKGNMSVSRGAPVVFDRIIPFRESFPGDEEQKTTDAANRIEINKYPAAC